MIIRPPKRILKKRMGIVARGHVFGEWGFTKIADAPKDAILYALSHREVWKMIRAGNGRARFWKKRYVAYEIEGRTVYSARDILGDLEPDEALATIMDWRDWAENFGANVTSVTGTSRSIWRASLPSSLLLVSGRFPVPSEEFAIGGRQEAQPAIYQAAQLWDIRSAYVSTMRELWVGARYRRYPHELTIPADGVGFARATVRLPRNLYWGMVPARNERGTMYFPTKGEVEGFFDLHELRTARLLGARVQLHEAWIGRGLRLPWKRWANLIETGYTLQGKAPRLVKMMANSLWGTFAVTGRGAWIHYQDGKPITELDARDAVAPCRALSAHISAWMRSRLLLEALHFNGHGVFGAHTDGVILAPNGSPVQRIGEKIGDWNSKGSVTNLVVLTPTVYSYLDETEKRRYVVAGTPAPYRERVFKAMIRRRGDGSASQLVGTADPSEIGLL